MACGVVPVVIDNGIEKFVVRDGKTGIVAKSVKDYIEAVEFLYQNPYERSKLSIQAKKYARENYHVSRTVSSWNEIYDEMMTFPKRCHSLRDFHVSLNDKNIGVELFLYSLGYSNEAKIYQSALNLVSSNDLRAREKIKNELSSLDSIFRSSTRGSVFHYHSYFRDCKKLKALCEMTRKEFASGSEI